MSGTEGSYGDALAWLFARSRGGAPRDPGRMTALLEATGVTVPPRVVHVAGTNGKGTVSAMAQAGLSAAGFRTGLFISPHVEDFRERVSVDGTMITREEVTAFVADVRKRDLPPAAFFELTLLMALRHFEREHVDFLVLEAGVGARNDATLAVGNTVLTVLTPVALDHTDTLGPTITLITADKAAAIRPGVPLVTMAAGEALEVVRGEADRLGSELVHPSTHAPRFAVPEGAAAEGTRLLNQQLAAAGLRTLGLPEEAVLAGVSRRPLPARGERFTVRGVTVILDGAHDPAAARALADGLAPGYTLVFGAQERKQQAAILGQLAPEAERVITVPAGSTPAFMQEGATAAADARGGLELALAATRPGGTVVIAGSLYLAGELRPLLLKLAET